MPPDEVLVEREGFIPFGMLVMLALWSMLIVVVGRIQLPFDNTQLIA